MPKPAELEGSYSFRNGEVDETLELKPGGVFVQRITMDGRTFNATGEWSIQKPRKVIFRNAFWMRFDTLERESLEPPQEYSFYCGYWYSSSQRIVFDDEGKYFIERRPSRKEPGS